MTRWMSGAVACAVFLTGCATAFTGSPHVEGGRNGCEAKCKAQGLELAGMVFMGEYSSACVCAPPGRTASGERDHPLASSAGAAGGSAGVTMQMQRQQQMQQQQQMQHHR